MIRQIIQHLVTFIMSVQIFSFSIGDFLFQFSIYKDIKEKYGDKLWLDVVSKCDLLEPSASAHVLDDLDRYKSFGPEGAIPVSVTSGVGVEEVSSNRI